MVSVQNISIHFSGTYIFKNVSFLINDKDRIGLVGKNGAGKSTLLKIICGLMEAEKGEIASPNGSTFGYLPQDKISNSSLSVIDEARQAFAEINRLGEIRDKIGTQLAERTDYESEEYLGLIQKLNETEEKFNLLGGNSAEGDLEKILMGLGFERKDFLQPVRTFSGGWQMRVELAKLLLQRPNVLLLDEPTNHLDIESIQWLEDFLVNYFGAVVLVSHDRAFLDAVTNRTLDISLGQIHDYKASYSDYVQMREERRESQMNTYNNQQRQIADIERFIERFRYKNTKAKQVQSRVKMLEKMDKVEIDQFDNAHISFRFPPAPHSGNIVLEAEGLSKSYGDKEVLRDLEFIMTRGEKIAFVGRNGEGKTTLSRMVLGELDYSGMLKTGHHVKIGYYAQNQENMLDMEKTVFQTIDDEAVGDMRARVKGLLGSFLFSGDDLDKKVKVLSGGEKARLALARLLLVPVNLLVLDEPTNHLDMRSKDILKSALLQYDGSLILVSHDRDFLQGLSDRVFEFRNKKIKEYKGDIAYFLESRRLQHLKDLEEKKKKAESQQKGSSENKLNYEKRKQLDRDKRKIQSRIGKCEEEMMALEEQIAEYDQMMAEPEKHQTRINDGSLYKEYDALKKKLEEITENWEEWHEKLEEIEGMI